MTDVSPPASPSHEKHAPSDSEPPAAPAPKGAQPPHLGHPLPIDYPLTSFASTPHNVAAIAFVLGSFWSLGLLSATGIFFGRHLLWDPTAAAPALAPQGLWTAVTSPMFGAYIACWTTFHLLEFLVTSMYNPGKLSVSSYLLDNGAAYHIAHGVGMVEYILEEAYLPEAWRRYKHAGGIVVLGALLVVGGQILRSGAMITASSNFAHAVAYKKLPTHELVKTGIYAWSRHPSYAGFVWWALGTQVMLANPVGALAFAAVLYIFFSSRIRAEEALLVKFFGKEYEEYRRNVPTRILFIR